MKYIYCLIITILSAAVCYSQVEGFVRDATDNETLPFTHVYNLTTSKGLLTDINGFYRIEAKQGDELQFSYTGYEKQKITVGNNLQINVKLNPDQFSLKEVVVYPGENPAHRIINNAIANRYKNNPDKRNSYSCIVYNKLTAEMTVDSIADPALYAKVRKDTASYLFLNESVIIRDYKYNNNHSEKIISARTSGFKEYQQMSLLQSMVQFFHFYEEVMEWKAPVKFFLNPISPGSTSKYFFLLCDTIVSGVDSTFIISYQPRRKSNFEGLKGLLYINSNGWAIQSVVAEPADYSLMCLKIQQNYALLDSVWFPSELSLELFMDNIANRGLNIVYRGKSHITEVDLNPDLSNKNIHSRNITLAKNAHLKHELIEKYRVTKLTAREDSTYRQYKEDAFDYVFSIMEGAMDNAAISVSIFDFPVNKIIRQNYTEGFRFGLGIFTNRHFSQWFSLGGYYGYGIDDRRHKYGASFSLFPEKHLDSEIKLWYANDLYDLTLSNEAGISARKLWGKADIETRFLVQNFRAAIDYSYFEQDMSINWERNTEAGFSLRYAFNEERSKIFRRSRPMFTTRHPVFFLNFYCGIADCFGSKYQYIKTEAGIELSKYIRNLGTTNFSIWGGYMNNETPFPLAFTVTDTQQSLFLTGYSLTRFNVLTRSVYVANQYLNVFLYHDFGTLIGKTRSKVFRPRIAVAQSFGLSKLNNSDRHISADFNILDMRKGYFESGIVIEDIIRLELFNMFFLGIGGGVYGAYGGSVEKTFEKTLSPKIRMTATF